MSSPVFGTGSPKVCDIYESYACRCHRTMILMNAPCTDSLSVCSLPLFGRDVGTLVQLGFAHHELCDLPQALVIYTKVIENESHF